MFSSLFKKIFQVIKNILIVLNSFFGNGTEEDPEVENNIFENEENNQTEQEKEQEEVIFNNGNGGATGLDVNISAVSSASQLRSSWIDIPMVSQVINGVQFTIDQRSNIIIANGTATGTITFQISQERNIGYGTYYLSGGQYKNQYNPDIGATEFYSLSAILSVYEGGMWVGTIVEDDTNGGNKSFNSPVPSDPSAPPNKVKLYINVNAGTTLDNVLFTPYLSNLARNAEMNDIAVIQRDNEPPLNTKFADLRILSGFNNYGSRIAHFEFLPYSVAIQNGAMTAQAFRVNDYYPTFNVGGNVIDCDPTALYVYDADSTVFVPYEGYIFTGSKWIQFATVNN